MGFLRRNNHNRAQLAPLWIFVEILDNEKNVITQYWMNHNDETQRRVLGEQCRNAFEGGQSVFTCPVSNNGVFPE